MPAKLADSANGLFALWNIDGCSLFHFYGCCGLVVLKFDRVACHYWDGSQL